MIDAFVVLVAVVDSSPGTPWIADLDRRRHVVADDLGRRARVGRDDRELRELDRRDQLLLQARQREAAEDGGDDRDEGDERAVLEAQDGEVRHGGLRCDVGLAPSRSGVMHGEASIRECIGVSIPWRFADRPKSGDGVTAAKPASPSPPRADAPRRRACRGGWPRPSRAGRAGRGAPSRPTPC